MILSWVSRSYMFHSYKKYPVKNYRLYVSKTEKSTNSLPPLPGNSPRLRTGCKTLPDVSWIYLSTKMEAYKEKCHFILKDDFAISNISLYLHCKERMSRLNMDKFLY